MWGKFLFLLLSFPSWGAANSFGLEKCESLSATTVRSCIQQIQAQKWWEPFAGRLVLVTRKWPGPLRVRFDPSLDKSAKVVVEETGGQLLPVILLGKNTDSFELILTLNHELVHYLNVGDRLKEIASEKKIKNCITAYKLATLKDEVPAFIAEIEFWKNAPDSFVNHFNGYRFDSKLLDKKGVDYSSYYRDLEKSMAKDKKFILKRYINLGEYPVCARNLI